MEYFTVFTLRAAVPSLHPSVAVGNVSIHRISAIFGHAGECFEQGDNAEWAVNWTSGVDDLTSLLR